MPENEKLLYLYHTTYQEPDTTAENVVPDIDDADSANILCQLLRLVAEQEADPIPRMAGYLITNDPTYLPEGSAARELARKIGRDECLALLIRAYFRDHIVSDSAEEKENQ